MTGLSEQRKELNKQREIRRNEEQVVTWIQMALDKCDYGTSGRDTLEESQFRNLVSVSDSTESPEVIKNFLKYQVGREKKWGRGKNSLASQIIQDIDGKLKELAQKIAKQSQLEDYYPIWIDLIRRYLGYGARYLTYKLKGEQS